MKGVFISFPNPLGTVSAGFITVHPVALVAVGVGLTAITVACYIAEQNKRKSLSNEEDRTLSVVA